MNNRKISGFVLAFFPLLDIYASGIPGISIGESLLLSICFIAVGRNNIALKKNIFFSYWLYAAIITIIAVMFEQTDLGKGLHDLFSLGLSIFFINNSCRGVDYRYFIKYLKNAAIICLIFFYFQYIVYIFFNRVIPGLLPLPLSAGIDVSEFNNALSERDRLSSLFTEPAHYVVFMLVPIVLFLFDKTRKSFVIALLAAISVVLSQSASGYLGLGVIISYYFFVNYKLILKNKINIIALIAVILCFVFTTDTSIFFKTLERFNEISFEPQSGSHGYSTYIRVLRGYIPFFEFDWLTKLFGNGVASISKYAETNPSSMYLYITDVIPSWINTFQSILLYTGVFGVCMFAKEVIYLYKSTDVVGRVLIIMCIALFLGVSGYFPKYFIIGAYIAMMTNARKKIN